MFILLWISVAILSCQNPQFEEGDGETRLRFVPSTEDMTRGTVSIGDYFSRLAVQMFDQDGNKLFAQSKTQAKDDDNFGTLNVGLKTGTYTVVAVGHSSPTSASIKSPQSVTFTAQDGRKITDTFCACGPITVGVDSRSHSLQMDRVTAMFRLSMQSEQVPDGVSTLLFDYTGGSAAFNPTTKQGTTKSTQSEQRAFTGLGDYEVFTFPYMSDSCRIKMTVSAVDGSGQTIHTRTFESVPMVRNRITEYRGRFFSDDDDPWAVVLLKFTANTTWDGIYTFQF